MFIDIVEIVLPVFLVIILGWFLRRIRLIDETFLFQVNRLVYYVCLPLLLFYKIATADFSRNFNGSVVFATMTCVVVGFAVSYAYAAWRSYPPMKLGTFAQGSFRGNLAYMGLAIVFNAHGDEGLTRASVLMGFLVPLYNLLAVSALLLPHRHSGQGKGWRFWSMQVIENPLILAACGGTAWSYFSWPLPIVIDRGLHIATGMTLPLALLSLGGAFSLNRLRGDLVCAGMAMGTKLLWMPLLAYLLLRYLGVSGLDLQVGVLLSAAPTAMATFIMAQQMKGDAELAGSIVVMTTAMSSLSYTLILFLLRSYA
ncbi:AEC family transporter [Desulfuromonas acetoxidans]|uniref:Auxin Efflux Carrier n=1 Tax=Desulfuromonas acetoxidans (strain DSM 684 / 11070) TaxID=281689 RepID=Q1K1G7_DESA6|nr:AEC family transporter [Desulfuromonas acetoxidans]EAT16421.1 Auxin Efflux Carrier [Desulfuromonas acetoxidans DSM 684]MBF0644366.1 AEC family transporter [Desulfuromonas acetoxidans]NVD23560.1 AEC family transporter [Desulfuromonas acetoxidans]NVE16055.1 AEC family transporter [Desulfuromonas acetoxidans]